VTLKVRLLVAMALVAVLLVVAAVTVTRTTTSYLVAQVDEQLVRFASGPGGNGPAVPPGGRPQGDPGSDPGAFSSAYVGTFVDGELQTRVAPMRGSAQPGVPDISEAHAAALAEERTIVTLGSTTDGSSYRILVRGDRAEEPLVVVGVPLDDVDATVNRLMAVEAVTTGVVLAVLALITWWVLRLGVRPIRRMTAAATTIAEGDLSHRVPEEGPGTEAHDLGVALNSMLARIEKAFAERAASEERLRRFVADASHELRTPVTTIRGYAELHRLGGLEDRDRLDTAMARTEAESIRMARLIEDLLTLARLDRGAESDAVPVDVAELVADVVEDFRVRHPDHPIVADLGPAVVPGDPDRLHQVVANLMTNAAVHTPPGTRIDMKVGSVGTKVTIVVRDHGPGLDEEAASMAFERFWRADASRSRASGGSGLGLSIVAAIVGTHGGSVRLGRPTVGSGVEAVVELPALSS